MENKSTHNNNHQVNELINKLKSYSPNNNIINKLVNESDLNWLSEKCSEIFLQQPSLIELSGPITIVGNTNGHWEALLKIFELKGSPPDTNYLFLGGYVNKGTSSVECLALLLAYKIRYPNNFFLLRGSDEIVISSSGKSGFLHECKEKYSESLWKKFNFCFGCMPLAAIIENRIFCVHGGLSPELKDLSQLENISRPCEISDKGMLCDLLWSDPEDCSDGWADNHRGLGKTFGENQVEEFLKKHNFDLVVRSHQVTESGYKFFCGHKLVKIFSAPNLAGQFQNDGAILVVDKDLKCYFSVINSNFNQIN